MQPDEAANLCSVAWPQKFELSEELKPPFKMMVASSNLGEKMHNQKALQFQHNWIATCELHFSDFAT